MLGGTPRCVLFNVCEGRVALLVYISWHTVCDTWLLVSSWRSEPRSRAEVVFSVLLAEMTQSVCFGSDERLLRRGLLYRSALSFCVICHNCVQFSINILLIPRKVRILPFAVAVRLRAVTHIAQNWVNFKRLEQTAVLLRWSDIGPRFGHVYLADTSRCDSFSSACTRAHVRVWAASVVSFPNCSWGTASAFAVEY